MLNKLVRPNIRKLVPYSSARDEYKGKDAVFLDANENPFNEPQNRYPDPMQSELKIRLSEIKDISSDQIFLGNGSDEVLAHIFAAFFNPDKPVVCPDVSYSFYPVYARA